MTIKERLEKVIEELQGESSGMSPYIEESDISILAQAILTELDKMLPEKAEKEELRSLVYRSGFYFMTTEPFKWMENWLNAYARDNELDVKKVMDWINSQPMTSG